MLEICLTSVFNLKGKYQEKLYHLQIDERDIFFFLQNDLLSFPTPSSCRFYQYEKIKVMLE